MNIEQLLLIANTLREDVVRMLTEAGSGHAAGSLGMADVFAALYFRVLKHDPQKPNWVDRDRLFLSNGHIVPVQYAAMARSGYFPVKELMTLRKQGSRLQGHPERTRLPGLESTSGPLGCGLSQAAGCALALRLDGSRSRVFCVASDGEHDEGNFWEGVMLGAKYALNNLTVIVDRNNIQISGTTEQVMPLGDLAEKWRAFGWHAIEVNGHDISEIVSACDEARAVTECPTVIIARTIPGYGVDFMENDFHWHGEAPTRAESREALRELRSLGGQIRSEYD